MEPTLTFLANISTNDTPYTGTGSDDTNYMVVDASDSVVFTGGGILGLLPTPTCVSGTRDATIKPADGSYVVPQLYIEDSTTMHNVPLVGHNVNRYCMCVYIGGTASSDVYLEAWDDNTLSTTDSEILQGSTNSGNNSYLNAIRTTFGAPIWEPGWNGDSPNAAYLRGVDDRIGLSGLSSVTDTALYYNIYIRLESDSSVFHNTPVLSLRYLYT